LIFTFQFLPFKAKLHFWLQCGFIGEKFGRAGEKKCTETGWKKVDFISLGQTDQMLKPAT